MSPSSTEWVFPCGRIHYEQYVSFTICFQVLIVSRYKTQLLIQEKKEDLQTFDIWEQSTDVC